MNWKIYIGMVALLVLVSGCIAPQIPVSDETTLKIGVVLPLTGFSAEAGENVKNGFELAKAELLAQGYIFELLYQDDECDPRQAIDAYAALQLRNIEYLTGFVCSGSVMAVLPFIEQDAQQTILSVASNPDLPLMSEYIYRVGPSDKYDALMHAEFISERDASYALVVIQNDYGAGIRNVLVQEQQPVMVETFNLGAQDFRSILVKIKQANVDVISLVGYPDNTIAFLTQLQELGMGDMVVIGSAGTITSELFVNPQLTQNFHYTDFGHTAQFTAKYQQTYNRHPDYYSQFGYDSLYAIMQASEVGIDNVVFEGATGTVEFNEVGERKDLYPSIFQFIEGEVVCYKNCQ